MHWLFASFLYFLAHANFYHLLVNINLSSHLVKYLGRWPCLVLLDFLTYLLGLLCEGKGMAFVTPLNPVQGSTYAERRKMLVIAFRCCLHFHWRPLLIDMSFLSLPSLHRWPTSPRSSYETFWFRFCSKAQNDQIHNSILSPGIIQFCSLSAFKILNEHDKCCIFRYAVMWKH